MVASAERTGIDIIASFDRAAALGSGLVDLIVAAKTLEWERYRRQVTPWEIETYLDRC